MFFRPSHHILRSFSQPSRVVFAAGVCGVVGVFCATVAVAGTYNAVGDFSVKSNPNGAWSYGTLSGFTGGTFNRFSTPETNRDFTGQFLWDNKGAFPNRAATYLNTTDASVQVGTVVAPANQIIIDGESLIAAVRWTAPAAGTYNVTGVFQRNDTSAAPVSVRIIENGSAVLFSADTFTTNGSQQPFYLTSLSLTAGATLDFAEGASQANNDSTGLAVSISTALPNFPTIHLVNDSSQEAVSVLNSGAPFITNFKGQNDVTITELSGQLIPVYLDKYGGATPGNNPSYLTTFLGAKASGTGNGVAGEIDLLDTNDNPPNVSLRFDFAQPLTAGDRIVVADVDNDEKYQIQAFRLVSGAYQPLSLTGWKHEPFTGGTGIQPDSTWPTWDPATGTLTSNAGGKGHNIHEQLDVLTPDGTVNRIVFSKLAGTNCDAVIQIVEAKESAPVITSVTNASATTGKAFSYQITASNAPTNFAAANLPPGLALSTSTGKISGTPTKTGTYGVTIAALNSGGSGSAKLTLTVNLGAPVITSPTAATATTGTAFSYQIVATNTPTSFAASGLPSGLGLSASTGKISGTPTKAGTYSVTLTASNAGGSGTAKLTLTVKSVAKPVITSSLNPPSRLGVAFGYQITATNSPTSYSASGLPVGLGLSTSTGRISGKPTKAGTYTVTISATNAGGSGTAKLTLVVKAPAPVITSALNPASRQGVAFSYQITATNSPTSYGASGLPAGLGLSASTGKISGKPTKAGTYNPTITATNNGGTGSAKLTLVVKSP